MESAELAEAAKLIEAGGRLPDKLRPYFQRGSSIGGARPFEFLLPSHWAVFEAAVDQQRRLRRPYLKMVTNRNYNNA